MGARNAKKGQGAISYGNSIGKKGKRRGRVKEADPSLCYGQHVDQTLGIGNLRRGTQRTLAR